MVEESKNYEDRIAKVVREWELKDESEIVCLCGSTDGVLEYVETQGKFICTECDYSGNEVACVVVEI